jgi:hypothetical protein
MAKKIRVPAPQTSASQNKSAGKQRFSSPVSTTSGPKPTAELAKASKPGGKR